MNAISLLLPLPVVPGPGPALDASSIARVKFLMLVGAAPGAVYEIEGSHNGADWTTVGRVQGPADQRPLVTTCHYLRATSADPSPAAKLFLSGTADTGQIYGSIPVPAANGPGAPVDLGALDAGIYRSFYMVGDFEAKIIYLEGSNDGIAWEPIAQFLPVIIVGQEANRVEMPGGPGGLQFLRTNVEGYASGTPVLTFGAASSEEGTGPGSTVGPFPSPPVTTTIYANAGGSDELGDGKTYATAYRTARKAFESAPTTISGPGQYLRFDFSDLGTEILPPDYELPTGINTSNLEFDFADPDFFLRCGYEIRARMKAYAGIPLADAQIAPGDIASIAYDPVSDLATLTLTAPRPSWAADALKGQLLRGTFPLTDNCAIRGSTALTVTLARSSAFFGLGPGPFEIVEPSARLIGSTINNSAAVISINSGSLALQGLAIENAIPFGLALFCVEGSEPNLESCQVNGLNLGPGNYFGLYNSAIGSPTPGAGKAFGVENGIISRCYFGNLGALFLGGRVEANQITLDGCPAWGPRPNGLTAQGSPPTPIQMVIEDSEIVGAVADGILPGFGVYAPGCPLRMKDVDIRGCAAEPISLADFGGGFATLEHVRSTAPNGGSDTLLVSDGNQARVINGDVVGNETDVGANGMTVGDLPVRTWADFYANPPIKQQYDLTAVAAGGATGTGSRVYQR